MGLIETPEGKLAKHTDFDLREYTGLRDEMLKHIDIEYQLTIGSVTAFAAIVALGVSEGFTSQGPLIVFLYPVLALLLTLRWRYEDHRTREIGEYIEEHIEKVVGAGREHYMTERRKNNQDPGIYRWSVRGMFTVTELLAILLGILLVVNKLPMPITDLIADVFLGLIALASFLITNMVFSQLFCGTAKSDSGTLPKDNRSNAEKILKPFDAFLRRIGEKLCYPPILRELQRYSSEH